MTKVYKKIFAKRLWCFSQTTIVFLLCITLIHCKQSDQKFSQKNESQSVTFLNHSDTAKYVGKETCRLCHQAIYNSFIQTGMGQSFDTASKIKSASVAYTGKSIYDKFLNLHYKASWRANNFYINEYRVVSGDTIQNRTERVNYIIGSGQHTNSHIYNSNGYLYQMPMTFYTQKKHWDLPPGFESGNNTRFSRKIGLECMSCHNGYPEFVQGSENKYAKVANGIDCERCHGPGSIHVQLKSAGEKIDTSKYIDYSIVNPAKLPIDLQFDLCQRCHLQGNTVLKEGKSFYDFKPGMKLSDYMTVFLPRYTNSDESFIMASHADRLKQSQCFVVSAKKEAVENKLKPYKDALTCVTCHNPHVSVKEMDANHFNIACSNCHQQNTCSEKEQVRLAINNNCVNCHMPKSGSTDIPHVSITDHFIRKPVKKKEVEAIKQFVRLQAINEPTPDSITMAKAYLNQYEKFEQERFYLDSANLYLRYTVKSKDGIREKIRYYFFSQQYLELVKYVESQNALKLLSTQSWTNDDAWACYRVGQSYQNVGNNTKAYDYYSQALKLAPYVLDFKSKLATVLVSLNKPQEAKQLFQELIIADPNYASAYCNLGYVLLTEGKQNEAETNYRKAIALDPNYEQALLNMAGLYLYKNDKSSAVEYVKKVLSINPENSTAKNILEKLKTL